MLFLAALILVVLVAPDIHQLFKTPEQVNFSRIKEAQKILDNATEEQPAYDRNYYKTDYSKHASFNEVKLKTKYFSFNPNHLPDELWKKLGLSEKQIKVIKNYELKGGRFYKKEDLQKIYSVTPEDYARLSPHIDIPERNFSRDFSNKVSVYKSKPTIIVEINHADSAQLTEIKGIGPAFANRILKYRNRLGGFYKKTQLMEVYGLDSVKYEAIVKQVEIDVSRITKININTCDFDDLKRNPYITFKQMNAIIQYRKQHGNYSAINDLKNVAILNDDVLRKIEPYLIFR